MCDNALLVYVLRCGGQESASDERGGLLDDVLASFSRWAVPSSF